MIHHDAAIVGRVTVVVINTGKSFALGRHGPTNQTRFFGCFVGGGFSLSYDGEP